MEHAHNFRAVSHPLRIHSGENALNALPGELDRLNLRRAFLLCGPSLANEGRLLHHLRELLGSRFAGVSSNIGSSVDRHAVEEAAAQAEACQADSLIAVGAGSRRRRAE